MTCFPFIWYSCFLFLFLGLMNYVDCVNLLWFFVASAHSLFPELSFTWLPVFIWCAPYHSVFLGRCLLVLFPPIFPRLVCVTVCDLLPMWPSMSLWIHFGNTFSLLIYAFSSIFLVVCPLFPIPFWIKITMVYVRVLLDYLNVLFQAIILSMTSLS